MKAIVFLACSVIGLAQVAPQTTRAPFRKAKAVLSVKDLGAVGDGRTDDSAAITRAIRLSSLSTCVHFLDRTYATAVTLSSTHPVCFTGNQWRLKYTGPATDAAVLSLIGDRGLDHTAFMEGSTIEGGKIDGAGNARTGILLQGVVSAQMTYLRVTNVRDAGVHCGWCQQVTFEHLMVSSDFEPFNHSPARGIVIDHASAANIFNQINIDHVLGNGIDILYGSGNVFNGGTSEGNGGVGVNCKGEPTPLSQCVANSFVNLDTEDNAGGDYLFTDLAFMNSIVAANSGSNPSIHFAGSAHSNTVVGGFIGASIADSGTFGNRLLNVSSILRSGTPWTDNGQNWADTIYNQFSTTFEAPVNNFNTAYTMKFSGPANTSLRFFTPDSETAGMTIGNNASSIGLYASSGFTASWLRYNTSGLNFMSETSPLVGDAADGSIVDHKWGFGRFNTAPAYRFHFLDSVETVLAVQAGAGQGGADLVKYLDSTGTQLSGVTFDGKWNGPIGAASTLSSGAAGQALCKKEDNTIGYCSSAVSASGACTCN